MAKTTYKGKPTRRRINVMRAARRGGKPASARRRIGARVMATRES
jgi:hypothetical protein